MEFEQAYRIAFQAFSTALDQKLDRGEMAVEIAPKFHNGTLILKPYDPNAQEKEVDIEVFFKKIISVRNNLRVLEQKINSNTKLEEAEKIEQHAIPYLVLEIDSMPRNENDKLDRKAAADWFAAKAGGRTH